MEDEIIFRGEQCQRRKPRAVSFTATKRQQFIDTLALTCNINLSAERAGVHRTTPYTWRARDPEFARAWREALVIGYERLESQVLEHSGAGVALEPADPTRAEDAEAPPPFDFDKAMRVLAMYRSKSRDFDARRPGTKCRPATREETNAVLLKAIAAAAKRLGGADAS